MVKIAGSIVDQSPVQLLRRLSGEFVDREMETEFLKETWQDYKQSPKNTLMTGGAVFMIFAVTDLLTGQTGAQLQFLLWLRGLTGFFLLGSAIYIHCAKSIFQGFHLLTLANQLVIAIALILMGAIKELLFIHNAFHVFMVTLVFYQFVHNRFAYTMIACAFFPAAYLGVNLELYQLDTIDIVRFALYLFFANALGVQMLRSLNHTRHVAYIKTIKERHLNRKLNQTVEELMDTRQEVKNLKGLIPICSNCKQIRDDKGYWSQIETYIQKHSGAKFSHGICPDCAKKLYPELKEE